MERGAFNHSVKVPKLYKCAARISQEVAGGVSSIKQLVYEKKHFNTKALYALVVTTCQKAIELDMLLKRTKLLEKETRLDPWLAKILISELLWGKMRLPTSDAKPILTILAYEQVFRAHLSDSSWDNFTVKPLVNRKPRYVRINTLITSINEAIANFRGEGWVLLSSNIAMTYIDFLEQISSLEGNFFLRDFHISDLLIFPHGTEFYSHPGYKQGAIILQDKASCLPAYILSPPLESVVLDMCAAPGMKTTQLAAILKDEGTIYAVERDFKRFEILKKIIGTSEATCIKVLNQDVLRCRHSDFPNVEYILVDPSCSGSGMTNRVEINHTQNTSRLQKLAGFQIKILRNALSRYPSAKKVVYSTCSLYPEENEDVVRQVLETNDQFKLVPAASFMNWEWLNFGSPDFGNIGKYCLYARPEEDLTHGFFLAVFERIQEGEYNEFYNRNLSIYRKNVDQQQTRKKRKSEIKNAGHIDKGITNNLISNFQENIILSDSINIKKSKKQTKQANNEYFKKDDNFKELHKSKTVNTNLKKAKNNQTCCTTEQIVDVFEEPKISNNLQIDSDVQPVKSKKKKQTQIKETDTTRFSNCYELNDCTSTSLNECVKRKKKKQKRHKNEVAQSVLKYEVFQLSDEKTKVKSKKNKRKQHSVENDIELENFVIPEEVNNESKIGLNYQSTNVVLDFEHSASKKKKRKRDSY